ncbi:hypothetical protein QEN19_002442 [Hanseniaspora menglaensis]
MLRKTFSQTKNILAQNNKRTLSTLSQRQIIGKRIVHNAKQYSKRTYSTGNSGTKLESTVLNYSVESVLSIGLSVLVVKLAYDFVYGEKKEPKKEEPIAESGEESIEAAEDVAEEPAVESTEEPVVESTEEPVVESTEEPAVDSTEDPAVESTGEAEESTEEPAVESTGEAEESTEEPAVESTGEAEEPAVESTGEAVDVSASGPAYNPETGEINWDCPCLGGMAHGPCGPEFKDAFSCFIYSEAEPKGVDCIEKFQGMQECFKKHPEVYAEQLKDEEPVAEHQITQAVVTDEPAKTDEQLAQITEKVAPIVEQIVPVVEEVVTEEIVPVIQEEIVPIIEEKIDPIIEEKIAPVVEDVVQHAEPESIEELVEEGLPINADD